MRSPNQMINTTARRGIDTFRACTAPQPQWGFPTWSTYILSHVCKTHMLMTLNMAVESRAENDKIGTTQPADLVFLKKRRKTVLCQTCSKSANIDAEIIKAG